MKLAFKIFMFVFLGGITQNILGAIHGRPLYQPAFNEVLIQEKDRDTTHTFAFGLSGGRLFFKPKWVKEHAQWRLFGPTGLPQDEDYVSRIEQVSADGDSLIVVALNARGEKVIHFVKLDKLKLVPPAPGDPIKWNYRGKIDWSAHWYNLPIFCHIFNHIKDPLLRVQNYRSLVMSRKGFRVLHYRGRGGKLHPDPLIGVDTLYMLSEDGRHLYYADPWLQDEFIREMTLPEDGAFDPEIMAASASTIMLMARCWVNKDVWVPHQRRWKKEHRQKVTIYKRYADFDSTGNNPFLPSTSNLHNFIPLVRYLPGSNWQKEEYLLPPGAKVARRMEVKQNGKGSDAREFRVAGFDQRGREGYYYKDYRYGHSQGLRFRPAKMNIKEEEFQSPAGYHCPHSVQTQGRKKVRDYYHAAYSDTFSSAMRGGSIGLLQFMPKSQSRGERGLNTKLRFRTASGKQFDLILFSRGGKRHLVSPAPENLKWRLVKPKALYRENLKDKEIRKILFHIFGVFKRKNVELKENADSSTVEINGLNFHLTFTP